MKAALKTGLYLFVAMALATAAAEEPVENLFLPADRGTLKKLADSRKLLAEGRFAEAVYKLGAILEGPEDFFFQPDKNSSMHRSLKTEARRLIGQMPREGRQLYELQYGARARRMLDEALEAGDATRLAEVSRRFFHTRSGYQATFLLGLHYFDHGQPLAGALVLRRLREAGEPADEFEPALSLTIAACWLQAGMPEKARQSLVALRDRNPKLRRVTVAGREVPLFNDNAKAVEWLSGLIGPAAAAGPAEADQWLMFRGDAGRNAPSSGGQPLLNLRWRVPIVGDLFAKSVLEHQPRLLREGELGRHGVATIPTLHPLAVGDVLLMRTLQNLLAVDFATGKRLWETPVDDTTESVPNAPAGDVQTHQMMLAAGFRQRMWGDMTYGTLSSDGRRVYSVESSMGFGAISAEATPGAGIIIRGGRIRGIKGRGTYIQGSESLCNRLMAYDIHTGKLQWELAGPAGPHASRQAETFFLGPPLPLMGQLYVLAEVNNEVRLLALEAATGDITWSQTLALAKQNIFLDPVRRWVVGTSPSYADGVLVCPTSTGAIVGVELATRSLLWGYCYSQNRDNTHRGRKRRRIGGGVVIIGGGNVVLTTNDFTGRPLTSRWIDGSVSISEGRVLVTPIESNWLYCLGLIDGKLLWKNPRHDNLYVACVDQDKVVLVGRRAVHALRLTDGKPAWNGRVVSLPKDGTPSGRGFLIKSAVVPAASSEQDARASGGGRYFLPLSNAEVVGIDLAEGKITQVSKSRKGSVPGNLICHRGKIISQGTEGVDSYWQLEAAEAETGRRLAANPDDAEALVLRGEILLDAGERSEAIASFRRAYELDSGPRTRELLRDSLLEGLGMDFAAYRGRGAEIERLLDDPSQHAVFLRLMTGGLRETGESASALECYRKLIDLEPDRRPLDRVDKALIVRRDRWVQGQLAELRDEAKGETAEKIDQLLRRISGAGLPLETEPAAPQQGDAAKQDADWPVGKVESATAPTKNMAGRKHDRGRNQVAVVEMLGSREPFFRDLSIQFDQKHSAIVAYDGWGRQRWQVSLAEHGQRQDFPYNRALTHARAHGRLLLVSLGRKIIAIDTSSPGPNGAPRVLWIQDLADPNVDSASGPFLPQSAIPPWLLRNHIAQLEDRWKVFGPVGSHYVCFRQLGDLVAVDPRSGETLWVRQDLPLGCVLFGDDQYVFALPPDRNWATVLRAVDGELVGTRNVPHVSGRQFKKSCLATLGRNLLLWRSEGNRRVLALVDPLEGRDVWPERKFSAGARACVVGEKAVGVMEPSGRFVLVSLPDGRTIADLKLEVESSLREIALFESGDQYFLLTHGSPPHGVKIPNQNIQPLHGSPVKRKKSIRWGRLYAFDREGKLSWPAPAEIKNQFMLANQPARLPVLTFGCQVQEKRIKGKKGHQYKVSVLCIDKRNGRTVYKAFGNPTQNFFQVVGDAEKKTVDLIMRQNTVTLTFTDKPLPSSSAADVGAAESSSGSRTAHAIWNSIQNILGLSNDDYNQEE